MKPAKAPAAVPAPEPQPGPVEVVPVVALAPTIDPDVLRERSIAEAAMPYPSPGRPPKELDLELVEILAGFQLTQEEIAAACRVSVDTLTRREGFYDVFDRGRDAGRASLRRRQFVLAMGEGKGAVAMAIFLGKQYLGQSDKRELAGPNGGPIPLKAEPPSEEALMNRIEKYRDAFKQLGSGEGSALRGAPNGDGVGEPVHPERSAPAASAVPVEAGT